MNTSNKPAVIYKYETFKTAKIIISDGTLKFTNPKDFNDPFDCDIANIYFNLDGVTDQLVAKELEILHKSFPASFLTSDRLQKAYEKSVIDKVQTSAITSFSLDDNSDLMWAHYGEKNKGVCLAFDNTMSEKDRIPDLKVYMEGEVSYDINQKINYCENKLLGSYRLFLTKKDLWRYEKEYRIISKTEGIHKFNSKFLKKVIIGLKVNDTQREEILHLLNVPMYHHVRVAIAEKADSQIKYRAI